MGASRRFLRDRQGQFAMITAIITPVALALAAFAVDAGSLGVERRHAQSLVDLAAITAAANLDKAGAAALLTMKDNGVENIELVEAAAGGRAVFAAGGAKDQLVAVTGRYTRDASIPAAQRFAAGVRPPNAAKVIYRTVGTRYFAGALIPPPEIVTAAVAVAEAEAAFSIGSRLAALDGGIANALLGGLLGAEISLSVMDYEALLDADVSLTGLLGALAADLDLTAATYDEVLDADVTVAQIATAMAAMDDLPAAAKAAANRLAVDAGGMNSPTLRLASLIGLGALGGQAIDANVEHLAAEVGVMELLAVSAIVAGGDHQVELDLGGSVPGLLGISLDLAIGEPPQHGGWFALGPTGTIVRTAQTRLSLVAQIGGPGGLLGARIRAPLYLELAFAEARLAEVSCPTGRPESVKVTVEARPGVADLYLAEVDPDDIADFGSTTPTSPARLVQAPLVTVTGHAHAEIADTEFERIEFDADDIAAAEIKQVSTGDFAASLTTSLFSDLSLDVKVAGLGLGLPSNVTGLLGTTISAAAPAIDAVLEELLAMLGLSLGQADIRVHSANCGRAVLVQ